MAVLSSGRGMPLLPKTLKNMFIIRCQWTIIANINMNLEDIYNEKGATDEEISRESPHCSNPLEWESPQCWSYIRVVMTTSEAMHTC